MDLDDPITTELRRAIIQEKPFLCGIYQEWFTAIASTLPKGAGKIVELGSGAGDFRQYVPEAITSEVSFLSGMDAVLDARALPFREACLRGIVMVDVLHHIPEPRQFFSEATRCLQSGGRISIIEPWVTPWSKLIYAHLHHEPFDPGAPDWTFPPSGPLSGANGALPWIIFERDRRRFEGDFPSLKILSVRPFMPFRYIVAGGVSMRSLVPAATFGLWRSLERALSPVMGTWAMFAQVVIERS